MRPASLQYGFARSRVYAAGGRWIKFWSKSLAQVRPFFDGCEAGRKSLNYFGRSPSSKRKIYAPIITADKSPHKMASIANTE